MLEKLKKEVYEANMLLPKYGLVTFTWGNVSGIDESGKYFVIKPSGIEYDKLTPEDMVVMDLDGNRVEGRYNPSSDTKTHLILYRNFKDIGGVVHILPMQRDLHRQEWILPVWEPHNVIISMEIFHV